MELLLTNKYSIMNSIPLVFWLIPIASVVALGMAWYFFRTMMKEDEGTDRMKEIAEHVRKGAMAYLKQQYKVVTAAESMGALCLPYRRTLLWLGRILWHEDRYLCFCPYSPWCTLRTG